MKSCASSGDETDVSRIVLCKDQCSSTYHWRLFVNLCASLPRGLVPEKRVSAAIAWAAYITQWRFTSGGIHTAPGYEQAEFEMFSNRHASNCFLDKADVFFKSASLKISVIHPPPRKLWRSGGWGPVSDCSASVARELEHLN